MYFITNWSSFISLSVASTYASFTQPLKQAIQNLVLDYCKIAISSKVEPSSSGKTFSETRLPALKCLLLLREREELENLSSIFLRKILLSLDSDTVTVRSRALKALSEIVAVDRQVLGDANVKAVVELRIMDMSKSVRDAAIELLGTFLVSDMSWTLIKEYYPILINRICVSYRSSV
jgi:hypothetical protein